MKKYALFLSLILLLYLFPAPAFAAGSAVFSLKPATDQARLGDTITITGSLAATESVAAFDILVSYPAELLQYTGGKAGSAIDSKDDFTIDQPGDKAAGKIQVLYVDGDGGASAIQKGKLFSLTFKLIGGRAGDSIKLGLAFNGVANPEIKEMQASASSSPLIIAAPLAANADLADLTIDHGSLNPAFKPDISSYNVVVPAEVSKLALKARAADSQAKVNIQSPELKKGGTTSLTVTVTAPSGTARTYTVNVRREAEKASSTGQTTKKESNKTSQASTTSQTGKESQPSKESQATTSEKESAASSQLPLETVSNNNNLAQLQLSSGRLTPAFSAQVTDYKVEVPAEINNLVLTARPADQTARLEIVNPELKTGENKATVTVTAAAGQKKTYTITVIRAAKQSEKTSSDPGLKGLEVEGYVLSPPFSPQRTEYVVYLPYEADHVNIKAVAEDSDTQTSISGNDHLKANEPNIITVAADRSGQAKKTYTIVAMRADQFSGLASLPNEELALAGPVEESSLSAKTATIYKILIIVLATVAVVEAIVLFVKRKRLGV